MSSEKIKGRGAQAKTNNRFSKNAYEHNEYSDLPDDTEFKTEFIRVRNKTIINKVPSPDIPMEYNINPYQGCEHGCSYCYARKTHEYWGYGAGIEFENNILIKENAVEALQKQLASRSWKGSPVMLAGNTDCYQPIEKKERVTRSILEVLKAHNNPVGIITKNSLIERDIDILSEMATKNQAHVVISVTTLNKELRSAMEPRTSTAKRRLQTIEKLSKANIPTSILIGPVIPGLNSQEIPDIIEASSKAGAITAGYTTIRLDEPVLPVFSEWLQTHFPDRLTK